MKKYLLATILFLFFLTGSFSLPAHSVQADTPSAGSYACVLQENAFFYSAPDERRGLFLLPTTYYVKLLDYGEDYCHIEYLSDSDEGEKLLGYAKTSALTFVDYVPKQPYFLYSFEIRYRIEDTGLEDSAFLNEITLHCTYYGDYKIGSKTYGYVLRGSSFGYVPKPADLTVARNTEYEEWLALQAPSPDKDVTAPKEEANSSPAQIAILVALCLLAPVLAALILKPPRRPPYELDER